MNEQVILVDKNDIQVGTMNKIEAHIKGSLHRAISVFIFNNKFEMLLQRRAANKYHSPGLWSNTACSHPKPNEKTIKAAHRRLEEEMGLESNLRFAFSFIYRYEFEDKLIEHEYDHVFIGFSNKKPTINPIEVSEYKYININDLNKILKESPSLFTPWFKICYNRVINEIMDLELKTNS